MAALHDVPSDALGPAQLSLHELIRLSRCCGRAFKQSLGLRPGDAVHIALPNCTLYLAVQFGTWLCGGVASLADPELDLGATMRQMEKVGPRLVVCADSNLKVFGTTHQKHVRFFS